MCQRMRASKERARNQWPVRSAIPTLACQIRNSTRWATSNIKPLTHLGDVSLRLEMMPLKTFRIHSTEQRANMIQRGTILKCRKTKTGPSLAPKLSRNRREMHHRYQSDSPNSFRKWMRAAAGTINRRNAVKDAIPNRRLISTPRITLSTYTRVPMTVCRPMLESLSN